MLIFLDVETTGLEAEDKICSIGLIAVDKDEVICKYDLVNEGKKIPPQASSINHITNEMIQGKPKVLDCDAYKFLQQYNQESTTIISHNAGFDLAKLSACGFKFHTKVIDTLRVAKHLIPECEAFGLQYLRYELKLYKEEQKQLAECKVLLQENIQNSFCPHHALLDAMVVKLLYNYLIELSSHNEMCELSFKNVLMQKFEFGKYAGRYIEEISMCDRGYLEWMLGNIADMNEDLRYSINYYLGVDV